MSPSLGIGIVLCALTLICEIVEAAAPIALNAGPMTMVFEPENAFLRYVKVGRHEILRGINAPVRNQFWGTVKPKVSNLKLDNQGDHFSLEFDAICQERDIDFRWHGTIIGTARGEVTFQFDGEAQSTFLRNRIGFCVLHGPSAAGQPWLISNTRGDESKGEFPTLISPHQPAKEIATIKHQVAPGFWARVRFDGDVFEMEDQRNWTDASFKTYCTPLERPYPVQIDKGSKVSQKIVVDLEGDIPKVTADGAPVVLTPNFDEVHKLPKIGLQVSSETNELSNRQIERLKALKLDHVRVSVDASKDEFVQQLARAQAQAKTLGVKLHVAQRFGADPAAEISRLASEMKRNPVSISKWFVLGSDPQLYQLALQQADSIWPPSSDVVIGVGQETNFVDLNRERPTDNNIHAATFAINPQIHAFDNASIFETMSIQADAVQSARQFLPKAFLAIGPITLCPQQVTQEPLPGELPSDVDARQTSLMAAAWTLGSVKYLARSNADSATYFETVGWKGVMDLDEESTKRPQKFTSSPGNVFPVYHVLRQLADFSPTGVVTSDSADPLSVISLVLSRSGNERRVLVVNLTDREQSVEIRDIPLPCAIHLLHADNLVSANGSPEEFLRREADRVVEEFPFVLAAHAIATFDIERPE